MADEWKNKLEFVDDQPDKKKKKDWKDQVEFVDDPAPEKGNVLGLTNPAGAVATGVNRLAFINLLGMPVDTAANLIDLGKVAVGSVGKGAGLLSTDQMPQPLDRRNVIGSSQWLERKYKEAAPEFASRVLDNPDESTIGRILNMTGQGLAGAMLGGPKAISVAPARTLGLAATSGAGAGVGAEVGGAIDKAAGTNAFAPVGGLLGAFGAPIAAQQASKLAQWGAAPVSKKAAQAVAGRYLNENSSVPPGLWPGGREALPGAGMPTPNAAMDPKLAQLYRSMRNPALPASAPILENEANRRSIATQAVKNIGQDEAAVRSAQMARSAATEPLYAAAKASQARVDVQPTISLIDRIKSDAPREGAVRSAMNAARQAMTKPHITAQGVTASRPITTVRELESASKEIRNLINKHGPTGVEPNDGIVRQLTVIKKSLDQQIGRAEPAYKDAQTAYQKLSEPIAQMQIGQELYSRMVPSISNDATIGARGQAFANALRDSRDTVRAATGFKRGEIENIMTPEQMRQLQGARQIMTEQDFIDRSRAVAPNAIAPNAALPNLPGLRNYKALGLLAGPMDRAIGTQLAGSLLDPALARKLMAQQRKKVGAGKFGGSIAKEEEE